MIVTVNGLSGSGKGTLTKFLSRALETKSLSCGAFFRQRAKELGIDDLSEVVAKYPELDKEVDMGVVKRAQWYYARGHAIVIEGRLPAHFLKKYNVPAFHILIVCKAKERHRRIAFRDGLRIPDARRRTIQRDRNDAERYARIYGVSGLFHRDRFDLVIDSTEKTPNQMLFHCVAKIESLRAS